eukprot:2384608-Prymnesium_polylepis.1
MPSPATVDLPPLDEPPPPPPPPPLGDGEPLCDACRAGRPAAVRSLLAEGAPPDAKDAQGATPL